MAEPRVSVVVLNWNGRDDTLACLESLCQSDYPALDLVVVDQGSRDGLARILQQRYPQVKTIVNDSNLGFSAGCNQGMHWGLARGCDFVLLLNNDTIVDRNCVCELIGAAEGNRQAGAFGPKILYHDDPQRIWSVGGILDFGANVGKMRGHGALDNGQFDEPSEVDFLSGCAIMARREAIEVVGMLSEDFGPAYYEDTDWGMRFRGSGFTNLVVPSARIFHKASRSTGGDYNPTSKYLMGHHAVLFMKKYALWHHWIKWILLAVLSLPFLYLVRAPQGSGKSVRAKGQGIWDGLRGVPVTADIFRRQW